MKKALLAVLFTTLAASWCLAQTDSVPAPTAEPCQPATCAMTCKPTVFTEPFVPKWAVGIKAPCALAKATYPPMDKTNLSRRQGPMFPQPRRCSPLLPAPRKLPAQPRAC